MDGLPKVVVIERRFRRVFLTQNGASGNLWARTGLCLGRRSPNYRDHVDVRFRVTSHGRDWLSGRESTASSGSSRCPSSPARYQSRTRFLFPRVSVPLRSEAAHRATSNPWSLQCADHEGDEPEGGTRRTIAIIVIVVICRHIAQSASSPTTASNATATATTPSTTTTEASIPTVATTRTTTTLFAARHQTDEQVTGLLSEMLTLAFLCVLSPGVNMRVSQCCG